jgi:hypothetical protein
VVIASAVAMAQAPPPAPPPVPQDSSGAPLYDPAQLPSFDGKVQQFTLTPRGDIDGLILTDGTEVKTPPHLSTAIAYAIKPGDAVTIHGLRAAAVPLLQAMSISDHTTHRSVVDRGAGPGPDPVPGPGAGPGPGPGGPASLTNPAGVAEIQGSIRMNLHGARGEINGVLLTDGTVLRWPPNAAVNLSALLQPGRLVVAQGEEVSNPIGKVLEVRSMGASRGSLTPIDDPLPPGPPGRARPPLPGRDAPPPPPPPAG